MNANLTKYLSDVFRNEVQKNVIPESQNNNQKVIPHLVDLNSSKFVLDKSFAMRLDEVI